MASKMTQEMADFLYKHGEAILEGPGRLTSHTTEYAWNESTGYYEAQTTGLRIVHRTGARWQRGRFVRCTCVHCLSNQEQAASVTPYERA